jgi:hypothetical protein
VDDVSKIVRDQTDDVDLRMEDLLKGAPKFNGNTEWDWVDRGRDKHVLRLPSVPMWCV